MNQPQSQDQNPLGSDETQALLAFNTNLLEHTIPQGQEPQEGSQESESAPRQEQSQEPQPDPITELQDLKTQVLGELQSMREDIKLMAQGNPKDERSEIDDLKKQIEQVLNSSD